MFGCSAGNSPTTAPTTRASRTAVSPEGSPSKPASAAEGRPRRGGSEGARRGRPDRERDLLVPGRPSLPLHRPERQRAGDMVGPLRDSRSATAALTRIPESDRRSRPTSASSGSVSRPSSGAATRSRSTKTSAGGSTRTWIAASFTCFAAPSISPRSPGPIPSCSNGGTGRTREVAHRGAVMILSPSDANISTCSSCGARPVRVRGPG